jgi:2-alkyl-3-oxoalkanoate reductase
MKIAVIGANGFIGTRLVEIFHLTQRYEVVPIVRKPASLALSARFALDWRIGDALDAASLSQALQGCTAAVHVAIGDPLQIERMPQIFVEAAKAAGVSRLVYLSSASVHGQDITPGTTEASPLHTRHSIEYNNAKVRAEQAFFSHCRKAEVAGYALRPGVVYGPRSRWIADLADNLERGTAWLYRRGEGICNSIYVDNLVHAVDLCLTAASGSGEAFLVGDAETVTWADFYRAAVDQLGLDDVRIHHVDHLPSFKRSFKEQVERTVAQPWVQSLLPAVPYKLKRATKTLLSSWTPAPPPDAWTLPSPPSPRIDEEMALLQSCRWKVPHTKAEKVLGYVPPVAFSEAMRRSFAWLNFARGFLDRTPALK